MSKLFFTKYQGAGNDFILIDNRAFFFSPLLVPRLCQRHYGIGADGVILLESDQSADFRMRIFNPDGSEAKSCGNGLRCLLRFLTDLGLPRKAYRIAVGGLVVEGDFFEERISLGMGSVHAFSVKQLSVGEQTLYWADTGVPHAVLFVPEVEKVDLQRAAPPIRHHPLFVPHGTNVNFASLLPNGTLAVRTFERGVEGETLACGTGAVAVALAASQKWGLPSPLTLSFPGGNIEIHLDSKVKMVGDAVKVFAGSVEI